MAELNQAKNQIKEAIKEDALVPVKDLMHILILLTDEIQELKQSLRDLKKLL